LKDIGVGMASDVTNIVDDANIRCFHGGKVKFDGRHYFKK